LAAEEQPFTPSLINYPAAGQLLCKYERWPPAGWGFLSPVTHFPKVEAGAFYGSSLTQVKTPITSILLLLLPQRGSISMEKVHYTLFFTHFKHKTGLFY